MAHAEEVMPVMSRGRKMTDLCMKALGTDGKSSSPVHSAAVFDLVQELAPGPELAPELVGQRP